MYFVQLRIAPQNPKTPKPQTLNKIFITMKLVHLALIVILPDFYFKGREKPPFII